jgi:hypothetical protein
MILNPHPRLAHVAIGVSTMGLGVLLFVWCYNTPVDINSHLIIWAPIFGSGLSGLLFVFGCIYAANQLFPRFVALGLLFLLLSSLQIVFWRLNSNDSSYLIVAALFVFAAVMSFLASRKRMKRQF